jgi:serine/threonine protein kinase
MPGNPSLDPRRTLKPIPSREAPSTVDGTGAYQSAAPTGPYFPAPPADAPSIPDYRIAAEIAHGGMGRVYAGHDRTLDREVAIKTLLPGANAERFVTEAKVTARLPHPGIPPVYALGTLADGTPYLAMKLIRGHTLAELLKQRPSPLYELPRFVQIFEQIAQAVGFAHAQGHPPPRPQAAERDGRRAGRGAGDGLGLGEGFGERRTGATRGTSRS